MEGSLDMELISKETIKPSQPTPPHLKVHHLSLIDQTIFNIYVPIIYFYHADQVCDQTSKVLTLKKSLSQILSKYYPFAGKLVEGNVSIDCNDEGALLFVTRVKSELSEILQNPIESLLSPLFPEQKQWKKLSTSDSLLAIQINNFTCGGMTIGVCLSHKIVDGASLFNFVNDWATVAREPSDYEGKLSLSVLDVGASMFPQMAGESVPEQGMITLDGIVSKRFVFEGSKIDSLKAMVRSQNVQNPTRVEVVTALIYKRAVSTLGFRFEKTSFVTIANIRRRMVPPLPDKSVGNMVGAYVLTHPFLKENEREVSEMVRIMKQGFSEYCVRNFQGKEKHKVYMSEFVRQIRIAEMLRKSRVDEYLLRFSSWCGFDTYGADFGWGKPIWATTGGLSVKKVIFFMDTRDGRGIEAIVYLEKENMAKFELDEELLQYASVNPLVTYQ